jgi:uncharacterized membrane protein YbhN (UPF0104 family)
MNWYPWIVLVHILAAFGFILGHGVSVHAAFRLRAEREPARVAALLDLSSYSFAASYLSLLVLLLAGITAGFVGGHWGRLWIWVSIGLLVAVIAVMYAIASPYYARVRRGVGQKAYGDPKDGPSPTPLPPGELAALLGSARAFWLAGVGGIGLAGIIGLMYLKPF